MQTYRATAWAAASGWAKHNWQYAGVFAAAFYLLLMPFWTTSSKAMFWLAIQLPLYMAHQLEEHAGDRFHHWVTAKFGGLDVLPLGAILFINVAAVWCADVAVLYLARFVGPDWAMLAFAAAFVNALVHLGAALVQRAYNPGLITAALLLLPGSVLGFYVWLRQYPAGATAIAAGLLWAVAVHVAIVGFALRRKARLQRLRAPA